MSGDESNSFKTVFIFCVKKKKKKRFDIFCGGRVIDIEYQQEVTSFLRIFNIYNPSPHKNSKPSFLLKRFSLTIFNRPTTSKPICTVHHKSAKNRRKAFASTECDRQLSQPHALTTFRMLLLRSSFHRQSTTRSSNVEGLNIERKERKRNQDR